MAHIVLDSQNYKHNLTLLGKKAGGISRLIAVLKDNAYGHGLLTMAKLASSFGIKHSAVKTYQEAKQIAHLFKSVLVLCEVQNEPIQSNISIAINQLEDILTLPSNSRIDLAIDSGMHRNGIEPHQIDHAITLIKEKNHHLYRCFTHYRSADILSSELFWQMQNFKEIKQKVLSACKKQHISPPLFHSANSATTLRLSSIDEDFVRCGIATYGYSELDSSFGAFDLRPVLSLWAKKMSSRSLQSGQKVGYGGAYKAQIGHKISNYDIGYGDGFFRSNGDRRLFAKDGEPILGKISMDSMSIQSEKEHICLFDDVTPLAKEYGTISYEIVTKLSPFLKKEVI
jgi:alanine racemase